MSDEAVVRWRQLTEETTTPNPRSQAVAWWGMVALVVTEATLFAVLLFAYFYLRWSSKTGWPPDGMPDPKVARPLVMTAILIGTAATIFLAERAARRGEVRRLRSWLVLTWLGGAAWLGLQAWDYADKARDFTPKTNVYGSLVYTLGGAHAAHLIVGLLIVGWVLGRAWTGAYDAGRHVGVTVAALYWYFVVAVGVVLFAAVTLSPHV